MIRRVAVGVVVVATLLVGAAYASAFLPDGAPGWASWAFVLGTAAMMVAMMVLGAARRGRSPRMTAWVAIGLTFVVLVAGLAVALLLPPPAPGDRLWLGLPAGAAAVLYGVGLLPLLVLPLAYAWSFDSESLGEDALARLRGAGEAAAAGARTAGAARERGSDAAPADGDVAVPATPRARGTDGG